MSRAIIALFCASVAYAQINGLTTSAYRTVTLTPDEVTFNVALSTGISEPLTVAVDLLKDTGITASNLLSITSYPDYSAAPGRPSQPRLTHLFTITTAYARLKEIVEKLEAARKQAIAVDSDLQYGLLISASAASVERTRRQVVPELLAEARSRAEYLAATAKMTIGKIITVNEQAYGVNNGGGMPVGPGIYSSASSSDPSGIRITISVFASWQATAE